MKKITVILSSLLLCFAMLIPVSADGDNALPLVIDNAELLSDAEERSLETRLMEITERLSCDVIVLTEDSAGGDVQGWADDYFDYNGYGRGGDRDGILLLVAMEEGEFHISGSGICNSEYISSSALDYISESITDELAGERFADAFDTFAAICDELISDARDGKKYKEPFNLVLCIGISVALGFGIAFLVTGKMKSDLKSVRMQAAAGSYVKENSFNLTASGDIFLYRRIYRTRREKSSSNGSHRSSSGRSHSGSGGRFR